MLESELALNEPQILEATVQQEAIQPDAAYLDSEAVLEDIAAVKTSILSKIAPVEVHEPLSDRQKAARDARRKQDTIKRAQRRRVKNSRKRNRR